MNNSATRPIKGTPRAVLDLFLVERFSIEIRGWAHCPGETLTQIKIQRCPSAEVVDFQALMRRSDVAELFPGSPEALLSGFSARIRIPELVSPFLLVKFEFSGGTSFPLVLAAPHRQDVHDRFVKGLGHIFLRWLKPVKRKLNRYRQAAIDQPDENRRARPVRQRYHREITAEVIVPVHDARQHVENLLPKLLNDPQVSRLWLVDDASQDPAVISVLNEAATHPRVELIRNSQNLGFVKSVNRALECTRDHCVILNTDVDVPPRWISRLLEPIRDDQSIASTTPFTNCGTIVSFPVMCQDNRVFDFLPVEAIDRHFAKFRTHSFLVDLPTGVGFCMGMSRTAIQEVGFFDAETFGLGYGEENDWSCRALDKGFRHVVVPNLYVQHAHGASFSEESKQRLLDQHLAVINRRYPHYMTAVNAFISEDPLDVHRDIAALKVLAFECSKNVVLYVDHNQGGGANHFRELQIKETVASGSMALLIGWQESTHHYKLTAIHSLYSASAVLPDLHDLFDILNVLPITEIQFNSLVFAPDVVALLNQFTLHLRRHRSLSSIFFLHDYHPLCPSHTLVNDSGSFCNLPSLETCDICLPRNTHACNKYQNGVAEWRAAWARFLKEVKTIRAFSTSSAQLFSQVFPGCSDCLEIKPHTDTDEGFEPVSWNNQRRLVVGVVGNIGHSKGAQVVEDLTRREGLPVVVIGKYSGDTSSNSSLTVHGAYTRESLPSLLDEYEVSVCFIPSIWPETYNLVADELMALKVPIVSFDIGGHAERLGNYALGHVLPLGMKDNPDELAKALKAIHANPQAPQAIRAVS